MTRTYSFYKMELLNNIKHYPYQRTCIEILPRQLFYVLALRQRLAHAGYLLGCEITSGTAEGESADVAYIGAHGTTRG